MNLVFYFAKIEIFKVFRRRYLLFLLTLTTIAYPLLIGAFISIFYNEIQFSSAAPIADVAAMVILLTTSIILLPLWITVFVGQEFSMNYVSRFIHANSRSHYFFSKIVYCLLVSAYFTFLSLLTIYLSFRLILFDQVNEHTTFFLQLVPQLWTVYTLYSLVCLSLVFLIRKPILSTMLLYIIPQVDSIITMVANKFFDSTIRLGPFEMIRMLYSESVRGYTVSYISYSFYNSLLPFCYVLLIIIASYRYFLRRDLKIMSE